MEGKKIIGIVGGMGPMATVALFRMIVEHTKGETDQDHIRILIDNHPQIPDRTKAILSGGPSPVPQIVSSAKTLAGNRLASITRVRKQAVIRRFISWTPFFSTVNIG